jgi:hypothetical protein
MLSSARIAQTMPPGTTAMAITIEPFGLKNQPHKKYPDLSSSPTALPFQIA